MSNLTSPAEIAKLFSVSIVETNNNIISSLKSKEIPEICELLPKIINKNSKIKPQNPSSIILILEGLNKNFTKKDLATIASGIYENEPSQDLSLFLQFIKKSDKLEKITQEDVNATKIPAPSIKPDDAEPAAKRQQAHQIGT